MTSLATRYQKDACGVQKFIGKSSNYWSSSPNANNSDNAWNVNFNNGNDGNNNKTNNNYVRLVRGGKWCGGSVFL